jgi:hypothetical protein
MLISEIRGWQWAITWDNPIPPDSSKMLRALSGLGKVTRVNTKTTVLLAPAKHVGWQHYSDGNSEPSSPSERQRILCKS